MRNLQQEAMILFDRIKDSCGKKAKEYIKKYGTMAEKD